MKALIALAMLATLGGCTTAQQITRQDGTTEFQVACGASTGWGVCYNRAQELCPSGYKTVMQDQGFNRKELRINCGNI